MRRVARPHVGHRQVARSGGIGPRNGIGVDRIRLVHRQGVEQHRHPGGRHDLGQRNVLMVEHRHLGRLNAVEHFADRRIRVDVDHGGQSVDEQAHHRLDALEVRRPTRHGLAEGDNAVARQSRQQDRPGELHDDRYRDAPRTGRILDRGRQLGVEDDNAITGQLVTGRHRVGCHQGRFLQRQQQVAPRRHTLGIVGDGREREEIREVVTRRIDLAGVGRPGGIQRQQIRDNQRRRPAVDQDVVAGDDQSHPGFGAHRDKPDQRRVTQIEGIDLLGVGDLGDSLRHDVTRRPHQVDDPPPDLGAGRHHRDHSAARGPDEAGSQDSVVLEQALRRTVQPVDVDIAVELQNRLRHIHIHRRVRAGHDLRLEGQSALQRRQLPHRGTRVPSGQRVQIVLGHLHTHHVRR